MMRLLNRNPTTKAFELPADGWFHLVPHGTYKHPETGLIQVLDKDATLAMENRFKEMETKDANFAGLLVDFDHFSQNPETPSEAAGWIEAVQNRADGLWGQIRFSDVGEAAVKGGRYRFVSPVWLRGDCENLSNDGRVRPKVLNSVALTNDPNLKGMVPLSNRNGKPADVERNQKGNRMTHEQTCALLGLKPEATDAEISAAYTRLSNRATTAEQSLATLTGERDTLKTANTALLNSAVERDLIEYKDVIADPAAIKTALLSNRDGTLAFLKGIKKPAAPAKGGKPGDKLGNREKTVHNPTNENNPGDPTDPARAKEAEALAAKVSNRARVIMKETKNTNFSTAFKQAQAEIAGAKGAASDESDEGAE